MALFKRNDAPAPAKATLGYALANKRLIRGVAPERVVAGEFPRYLYREEPDGPGDSGWRVFTGREAQDDADDPSNLQINAVETLLMVHPQLAQVLAPGVGGAWEWSDGQGRYVDAIRTARSRSSGGYRRCDACVSAMPHPHFQGLEPPAMPGRFSSIAADALDQALGLVDELVHGDAERLAQTINALLAVLPPSLG